MEKNTPLSPFTIKSILDHTTDAAPMKPAKNPITLYLILLFLVVTFTPLTSQASDTSTTTSTHSMLPQDEDNSTPNNHFQNTTPTIPTIQPSSDLILDDVPGPAAFLGIFLKKLTIASTSSDLRITELLAALPKMFPELYKVLTEL